MFCCKLTTDISPPGKRPWLTYLPTTNQEAPGMIPRRRLVLALLAVFASMGATYRTPNFVVYAPTPQIAEQIGQWAEHYRKDKALQWLGQEMPPWPQPCPLHVQVTMEGPSGATT